MVRAGISFVGVQAADAESRAMAREVMALDPEAPVPVTAIVIPTAFTRPSENCSVSVPGYVPGVKLLTIGCTTTWVGSVGAIVASVGSVTSEPAPPEVDLKLLLVPVGS